MSTKTKGLALSPKKSSLTKFVLLALLVIGIWMVLTDPAGAAAAVQSGATSVQTFWKGLHIGGGGS